MKAWIHQIIHPLTGSLNSIQVQVSPWWLRQTEPAAERRSPATPSALPVFRLPAFACTALPCCANVQQYQSPPLGDMLHREEIITSLVTLWGAEKQLHNLKPSRVHIFIAMCNLIKYDWWKQKSTHCSTQTTTRPTTQQWQQVTHSSLLLHGWIRGLKEQCLLIDSMNQDSGVLSDTRYWSSKSGNTDTLWTKIRIKCYRWLSNGVRWGDKRTNPLNT